MSVYCPFCGNEKTEEIVLSRKKKGEAGRRFFRCAGLSGCGGVFVPAACFLSVEAQKERYLLHNNSLEFSGYRSFLTAFIDTVLRYSYGILGANVQSIFDYGCGFGAASVRLLEEYKRSGRLPAAVQIRGWDPLFAPDTEFFCGGADLVLCLEVAEHFEKPAAGFAGLAKACRRGGVVAVQTLFVPETQEDFETWWYKEDPTHVSFYTEKSLIACGKRAGFEFCGLYNNCSIFRAALPR